MMVLLTGAAGFLDSDLQCSPAGATVVAPHEGQPLSLTTSSISVGR
jgi:hypothetical protein